MVSAACPSCADCCGAGLSTAAAYIAKLETAAQPGGGGGGSAAAAAPLQTGTVTSTEQAGAPSDAAATAALVAAGVHLDGKSQVRRQ